MMPAEIPFEQFPGLGRFVATSAQPILTGKQIRLKPHQGTDEYPGFPADGCPPLPDLSRWVFSPHIFHSETCQQMGE